MMIRLSIGWRRHPAAVATGQPIRWAALCTMALACVDTSSTQAQRTVAVGPEPSSVVIADFDGDGDADLAVTIGGGNLAILLGDGQGAFDPPATIAVGSNPVDVTAADFDEDGVTDLAVANHETDYVSVFRGDGRGGFAPFPTARIRPGFAPHPHAVRAADMDRDGHADLLVDHREAGGILLMRGVGTGAFGAPSFLDTGGDPYRGMALGDVDGDGWLDLVTPNPREAGVVVNENGAWRRLESVPATSPFAVGLADVNADGRLDLVTASESGPAEIFFGLGNGSFSTAPDWAERMPGGGKSIATGDFDGDGVQDVAVANYFTPEVTIVFGDSERLRVATLSAGEHPWGAQAGDVNGDGRDDLIIPDSGSDLIYLFTSVPSTR